MPDQPTAIVADDVMETRELLRHTLEKCGCNILCTAEDGDDALEKVHRYRPDILFVDIDMPKKTGLQVLRALKNASKEIFVVMVSGHSTLENVQTALEQGADGFIVKPFTMQRVQQILAKYAQTQKGA